MSAARIECLLSIIPQSSEMFSRISMVVGIDERSIFSASLIIDCGLRGLLSTSAWRLKERIWPTRSLARCPARRILSKSRERSESVDVSPFANSAYPSIMLRILLKSWAIPPASVPMASIFWAWRSRVSRFAFSSSDFFRSVIFRPLTTKPIILLSLL